ncbi:hypothetical protein JXA47_17075 [Candidatus Sumerlaeota bacterium]|nr:hypothetical protein [Candidatus Sumerlaeota bacterium]
MRHRPTPRFAALLGTLALCALCGAVRTAAQGDEPPVWESPFFRVHAPPELADSADDFGEDLEIARHQAGEHWTIPLNTAIDVFIWPRESWENLVRADPAMRDVLAFVRSGDQSMIINFQGAHRAGIERFRRTLVHEYTHAYFGRMIARWPPDAEPRRLPRWMEEGLAMAVAGESHWWSSQQLLWQGPERMIPLMRLAENFPDNPAGMAQAYRQSADAVGFLLSERGSLTEVIDEIVDPQTGPAFLALTWEPDVVRGLEQRWHDSLRLGWRWMLIFTTGGFAWALVMVLAMFAWLRRRQTARRKMSRWAMEAEGLIPAGLDDEEQDDAIRRLIRHD